MTGYPSVFSGTTINWGDGTTSPGTVTWIAYNQYTVSGSHTYTEEGSYPVIANVVNSGGATLTSQVSQTVLVSDPAVVAAGVSPISASYGSSLGSQALATFTDPAGARSQRRHPLFGYGKLGWQFRDESGDDHLR